MLGDNFFLGGDPRWEKPMCVDDDDLVARKVMRRMNEERPIFFPLQLGPIRPKMMWGKAES